MKKTPLYIGIEIKVREFEPKLFLACVAAEAGYDVILGQQRIFKRKLPDMPRGIYLDKSAAASKADRHRELKQLGFRVVAGDEEGLAFFQVEEYKKRRLAIETLQAVEYFFAWGTRHAEIVKERVPDLQEKVKVTGHPRIDLTRPEIRNFYAEEAEQIRQRYGKFLLINTNFSFCNHARGKDVAIDVLARGGKIADEAHRQYYLNLRAHKQHICDEFVTMIKAMHQRFLDTLIIIRPHPAENHDFWRQILPDTQTVQVVHEGNVHPWLMAAEVTIHNSCTTGIEAYLLDRPVIAYQPIQAEEFDIYLANALSEQTFTLESLLEKLEQILQHTWNPDAEAVRERRKIAQYYMHSLKGPLASERIVAELQSLPLRNSWQITAYRSYAQCKKLARKILKPQIFRTASEEQSSETGIKTQYIQQKFPGLTLEEIQQTMAMLRKVTGRFSTLHVTQLEENMFLISQ